MNARKKITATLDRASSPVRWIWPRLSDALIGIMALGIIVFCCLTYSTSLARRASELFSNNQYLALIDGFLNPFRNRHLLLNSGLPIYDLKISRQEYAKVEQAVEQNIKRGYMTDDAKLWSNAQFIHDGQMYNVKVRVRGALAPHWAYPKKSWRIKFGNEMLSHDGKVIEEPIYFQGKRQINLIIPSDKRYALAYFINELLRNYKLVTMQDNFVILRINGVIQGLYYEVEQFDKPMLAAQGRPETTIFGQNGRAMHFEQYTKYGTPAASDGKYDLGSLQRQVDAESDLGLRAMEVLNEHALNPTPENFRRARAVLDWEKYLRFRCITTLCNTNHVRFGSDNLKLYFDPSRGLLEPIPWDILLVKLPKEPGTIDFWNNHGPDELQKATLLDPMLRLQRNKMLWEWVGDGGDSLMAQYNKIHNRIRPYVWADVLNIPVQAHKMDLVKKEIDFNVRRVYKVLSTSTANCTYKLESPERAALEIAALNFSGIQLRGMQLSDSSRFVADAPPSRGAGFDGAYRLYEDRNANGELDSGDPLVAETLAVDRKIRFAFEKYIFPELKYRGDMIENRYWEFFDTLAGRTRFFLVGKLAPAPEERHPLEFHPPQIEVTAINAVTELPIPSAPTSLEGIAPENSMGITAVDASDPWDLEAPELTLAEFLQRHPEFSASREVAGAVELSGKVTISGAVIVPKSVPLILRPGTDITMKPRAIVLCYGGLTAIGTPEQRIRIHGDGSGKAWDTFAVVSRKAGQKVVMEYTDISDGGQAQINGMLFTGGFAVHNGDLEMAFCRIMAMQSEDGLNLKNGHIVMRNCLISETESDAFDLDFCTGEIRDSQFSHTGGDGIDFSGSRVLVAGCRFENIGDKGTSVGEDSHPILINNLYLGCNIGVSCKDLSSPKIANCTFVGNNLAIEAKRKKPFFGGGSGEFVNCVFSGNKELLQEDYFSREKVKVSHSLVDEQIDWPTCVTTAIRFVSPETGNYLLAPPQSGVIGDGFMISLPEWAGLNGNGPAPRLPGIFTNAASQLNGQAAQLKPGLQFGGAFGSH
jgi:spore coat protein CotH